MDKQLKTLEKEINNLEEKILSKRKEIIIKKLNIIESKKDDKVILDRDEWEILRKYLEENGDQTFCKMQHEFSMEDDYIFDDYYETVVKLGNRYISVFDGIKEEMNTNYMFSVYDSLNVEKIRGSKTVKVNGINFYDKSMVDEYKDKGARYEFKVLFGGRNELTEPLKINKLFL